MASIGFTYVCGNVKCGFPVRKRLDYDNKQLYPPDMECKHCKTGMLTYYGDGDLTQQVMEELRQQLRQREQEELQKELHSDSEEEVEILPPPPKKARVTMFIDLTNDSDPDDPTPVVIVTPKPTLECKGKGICQDLEVEPFYDFTTKQARPPQPELLYNENVRVRKTRILSMLTDIQNKLNS